MKLKHFQTRCLRLTFHGFISAIHQIMIPGKLDGSHGYQITWDPMELNYINPSIQRYANYAGNIIPDTGGNAQFVKSLLPHDVF